MALKLAYVKKPYLIEKIGIAIRDELDRKKMTRAAYAVLSLLESII
jgi:hypothetical protein